MRPPPGPTSSSARSPTLDGQKRPAVQLPIPASLKMSAHLSQSEGRTQPVPANPHQPSPSAFPPAPPAAVADAAGRAALDRTGAGEGEGEGDTLCIRVLEDSPDAGVFVVRVQCQDPLLLAYWQRKAFFYNGQVQQTDARLREDGAGLAFVLHALHRSQRLANSHYWTPFVVGLCLDALLFRYRLPPSLQWNGDIQHVMQENTLVLTR
ncbi:uncharacterized protein LOC118234378 [Anguilla anguilla]|uniref:uncharacterized protein LOC118234378 n=1 Tax=Anguilla anguilla TaxID=7936 RepID=UPI0015AD10C7|nr:uncharacterized protein LOC118234378 [Anguilla anguilla]